MSMNADAVRYRAAGLNARFHWWERESFIKRMEGFLARLKADENARPCMRPGLDEGGMVRYWFYLDDPRKSEVDINLAAGDCEPPDCFDDSHPCPPLC